MLLVQAVVRLPGDPWAFQKSLHQISGGLQTRWMLKCVLEVHDGIRSICGIRSIRGCLGERAIVGHRHRRCRMAADEVKITGAVVSGTLDPTKSHLTSSLAVSHSMSMVSLAAGRIYWRFEECCCGGFVGGVGVLALCEGGLSVVSWPG